MLNQRRRRESKRRETEPGRTPPTSCKPKGVPVVDKVESPHPRKILVNRREAAWLLGVSANTVDNLRLRGELPSAKIAARRLYDIEDIRRFIESKKSTACRENGGVA